MIQPKILSLIEFQDRFSTEKDCQQHLFKLKWSKGFICPKCGHTEYYFVATRHIYQCRQCRYQSSLTSNTVMHRTRTPLRIWFWMIYLLSRDKRGKSSLSISKELHIHYSKAWAMTQKIRSAMAAKDAFYQLAGLVEVDEAYFGGPNPNGKRGRGTGKAKALVEISLTRTGKPKYAKIQIVNSFQQKTVQETLEQYVVQGSTLQTDGYRIYARVHQQGFARKALISKSLTASDLQKWIHIIIGNAKAFIQGTYHGLDEKHLQSYLDEFCYRFNRRFWEPQLFNRLLNACLISKSVTYAELMQ
jgi:transposase-like protein